MSAAGRLARADLVIVVEAPLAVCLWRVIKRSLSRRIPRPDSPAGGREQVSVYFLWWILTWTRRHPHLADALREQGARVLVVRALDDLSPIVDAASIKVGDAR